MGTGIKNSFSFFRNTPMSIEMHFFVFKLILKKIHYFIGKKNIDNSDFFPMSGYFIFFLLKTEPSLNNVQIMFAKEGRIIWYDLHFSEVECQPGFFILYFCFCQRNRFRGARKSKPHFGSVIQQIPVEFLLQWNSNIHYLSVLCN